MRVVLDTNILISALISAKSAPAQIFDLWLAGALRIVISQDVINELQRVLMYSRVRNRLRYTDEQVQQFLLLLHRDGLFLEDLPAMGSVAADPDDDKFLALAYASKADYIISGDDHLLSIGVYQGIAVVTAADFLARFASSTSGQ